MDESFDELVVPDRWLERVGKRKLEESTNSDFSYTKQQRLSASSPSSPSRVTISFDISSTTEPSSDLEIVEVSSVTSTVEDISINEPDFNSNEDSSYVKLEASNDSEINCHSIINKNNGVVKEKYNESKWFVDDSDSKVKEVNSCCTHENRMVNGNSEEIQETLNKTKHLIDDRVSKTHQEKYFSVDSEGMLTTECNKMKKNGAPNCFEESDSVLRASISPRNQTSSEEIGGLKHILSIVRDAKVIAGVVPNKDFSQIYNVLLEHREKNNRLDIVTFQLTNPENTADNLPPVIDIFEEVQQVVRVVPSADVNEIYSMLEHLPPSSSRIQHVIANIRSTGIQNNNIKSSTYPDLPPVEVNTATAPANDQLLENDPLFQDMRIIAKMFPEKDRNEIYALLEANIRKENRLETVINEILRVETGDMEDTQQTQSVSAEYTTENIFSSAAVGDTLGCDMEKMRNIFPDCDPNYLYERLENMKTTANRTEVLAAEMFEKREYPKLKDLLDKEKEKEKKNKARLLTMTPKEFLQKFPEPVKTFSDVTKEPSGVYKQLLGIFLQNEFPMLKCHYLEKIAGKHNGHLYLTYQEITALLLKTPLGKRRKKSMFLKVPRLAKLPMPDTIDEYFNHELWFVYNELSVLDYIKETELQRKLKLESAKLTGELFECCCCYDDECLLEDLARCPEGHLFCKTCVVRSTEAAFGEMKTKFPCLTGECDQDIPLSYLQTIIPANLFSKIVRRLQEEEIQQASIPDLVTCPFCPFAAIMTNPDDKIFKCLNPECLKESCRLCQEPNHIPLRCNEVEKKAATDMRVYIENKISEAVMRKCHKCGKRFVKDDGCNKMTCVCGATSCYACKAADIDYQHFNNNTKCANTDPNTIHQRDMEDAAIKAKNEYLLDHPEAADVELRTDVKDMIKDFKNSDGNRHGRYWLDQEYDESDDDSEDYVDNGYGDYAYGYDESDSDDEGLLLTW